MARTSSSASRHRLHSRSDGEGPIAPSLVRGTLRALARQRPGLDRACSTGLLDFLESSEVVARSLVQQLAISGVSEGEFAVLIALFAIDPGPVPVADLPSYTELSSAALECAINHLAKKQRVQRRPAEMDRHVVCLHLTPRGRKVAEAAALGYLKALTGLGEQLEPRAQSTLGRTCRQLATAATKAARSRSRPFRP